MAVAEAGRSREQVREVPMCLIREALKCGIGEDLVQIGIGKVDNGRSGRAWLSMPAPGRKKL